MVRADRLPRFRRFPWLVHGELPLGLFFLVSRGERSNHALPGEILHCREAALPCLKLERRGRSAHIYVRARFKPKLPSCASSSAIELHGRMGEFCLSSGGFDGRSWDQPPQPMRGSRGRLCSQARQTSDFVPARPPITMQASPASAISRFLASPIPLGMTTVAGQSAGGISPDGTMLTTMPPASIARSAATCVAGLPQPLTTVTPILANSAPAAPANS